MNFETNFWKGRKVVSYAYYMQDDRAALEIKIDLKKPVAIEDFIATFEGFGGQFERYLKAQDDKRFSEEVGIYVKEIRKGSMIAELIPVATTMISGMDQVIIVEQFAKFYSNSVKPYLTGQRRQDATKSDLVEVMQTVTAVANDPNGEAELKTVRYEDGKRDVKVLMSFTTKQAKKAVTTASAQIVEIEGTASEIAANQLMVFYQSTKKDSKKAGDKAVIESVSSKPVAVLYASDLAQQKIKGEMLEGDRNLYKLGFFVDVDIARRKGKPVAYRVTHIHDVIELPDDDD